MLLTNPLVTTENTKRLLEELKWLEKLVQCQIAVYKRSSRPEIQKVALNYSNHEMLKTRFDDPETIKKIIAEGIECISPPPIQAQGTSYAGIVCENELGFYDRLLLILALAPHIDPLLLQNELMEKGERINPLVGGMRGTNSGLFLPTGQTFIFLAAGNDIEKRMGIIDWLSHECILIAANVISIQPIQAGEVFFSGGLEIDEYYLELLLTNRTNKTLPTENHDVRTETTSSKA